LNILLLILEDTHSFSPTVYPPLGLLYIASELEQRHSVSIYDLRDNPIENIPNADIIACSATTSQSKRLKEIAPILKEKSKLTIIGGAYASWTPEDIKPYFDCVVIGEGEGVINYIIDNNYKGIINAKDYNLKDINSICFPARHLLPKNRILSTELWGGYRFENDIPATTLITSRGCPWKCSFCANIPQKVRYRTPENIIKEIENIITDYNCYHFRFLDDNFIMNVPRLRELCNMLAPLNIHFRCSGRSDLITEEICSLLQLGGCNEIGFGVESCDDSVLKIINKNETVDDHEKAIIMVKKYNIKSKVFFMSGLPGETWETIKKNKEFIERVKPDKWFCTLFTPYPGCDVWNNPEKYNVEIINKDFANYYQTFPTKSTIKTDTISNEELNDHHTDFITYIEKQYK